MQWFLTWVLALEALALAALPLSTRLFDRLPDRGFLFAKPLGILLVGYCAWLTGVFGLVRYDRASLLVLTVLLGAAVWVAWGREALRHLASVMPALLVSEGLFLLFLGAATAVRAYSPEIAGTEKPMDFAFLNALHRTETLPPEDPWMSGRGISYYYFGYLLISVVGKLSGVPASVAYNLGVALVFALLLALAFSLAYSLLGLLRPMWGTTRRSMAALFAPLMVGLMGNLEIGLEVLAARGYSNDGFWKLTGIKGLQVAAEPQGWFPSGHWWWWRASRVIPTTKPDGINEFPYFSFLLGDLHPHYTVLPWALLAVGLALAAFVRRAEGRAPMLPGWTGLAVPALVLGSLLVSNSWDFPTYTGLVLLCALIPLPATELNRGRLLAAARPLAALALASVLLYLPFLLGFSSQTRGLGLSGDQTPLPSLLIIFGPFLLVLLAYLCWRAWPPGGRRAVLFGAALALAVLSPLLGSTALLLGLLALVALAAMRLAEAGDEPRAFAAAGFVLILVGTGLLLVLGPEFVFIMDLFGTRMNTVFKFHYQAWLLLGVASTVALAWMGSSLLPTVARAAVLLAAGLLVSIGLLYPLAATAARAQDFRGPATLDGAAFLAASRPDDFAAIRWLSALPGRPVVAEAAGGAYSEYARISTFSGLPAVLGWGGHETQWRGRSDEVDRRTADLDTIYRGERSRAQELLKAYGVRYVVAGSLEAEKYGPAVAERFDGMLDLAFRQGRTSVYRVPG